MEAARDCARLLIWICIVLAIVPAVLLLVASLAYLWAVWHILLWILGSSDESARKRR